MTSLKDKLREAVAEIRLSGAADFDFSQLRAARNELSAFSDREIKQALHDLWKAGEGIYSDTLGGTLWTFGQRPFPDLTRRPIGRR